MKKETLREVTAEKLAQSFGRFAEAHEKSGVKKGRGSYLALAWLIVMCRDYYGKAMVADVISTYRKFNKKAA